MKGLPTLLALVLAATSLNAQGTESVLKCAFNGGLDLHATSDRSSATVGNVKCGDTVFVIYNRVDSVHLRTKDGKDGYITQVNMGQWSFVQTGKPVSAAAPRAKTTTQPPGPTPITVTYPDQTPTGADQGQKPLTNESIVKLVQAGLGEATILSIMDAQPGNYSVGADDVIALKRANVSEKIITTMVSKSPKASNAPAIASADATQRPASLSLSAPEPAPSANVNKSLPNDPGLYAVLPNGELHKIAGRPTNFVRTGSRLASGVTLGIHARRTNTQIAGKAAYLTVDRSPTFLYRVGQRGDQSVEGTINFILTELSVVGDRRQFEFEASGAFRKSRGISVRHQFNFDAEEVESGLYRLRPDKLEPGQYAFFLLLEGPEAQTRPNDVEESGFIYDFGVE